jgi:hypothetical protein
MGSIFLLLLLKSLIFFWLLQIIFLFFCVTLQHFAQTDQVRRIKITRGKAEHFDNRHIIRSGSAKAARRAMVAPAVAATSGRYQPYFNGM